MHVLHGSEIWPLLKAFPITTIIKRLAHYFLPTLLDETNIKVALIPYRKWIYEAYHRA